MQLADYQAIYRKNNTDEECKAFFSRMNLLAIELSGKTKNYNDQTNNLVVIDTWLYQVFYKESTLNSQAENSDGSDKYYGLCQISSKNLKTLRNNKGELFNITPEKFKSLKGSQQVSIIGAYLKPYKGYFTRAGNIGLAIYRPTALTANWSSNKVLEGANDNITKDKVLKKVTVDSYRKWIEQDLVDSGVSATNTEAVVNVDIREIPFEFEIASSNTDSDEWVTYHHIYSNITNLNDLIDSRGWFNYKTKKKATAEELLNYRNNKENIRNSWNFVDKRNLKDGDEASNLRIGVKLDIPVYFNLEQLVAFDGNENVFKNDDTETFISEALKKVVVSPEYRFKSLTKLVPKLRVWCWVRSLGLQQDAPQEPRFSSVGAVFDLSPFITSVTTTTTKQVGAFSFSLPSLMCESTKDGFKIKQGSIHKYDDYGENSFIAKTPLLETTTTRNEFLFNLILSQNDIVFISLDAPDSDPIESLNQKIEKSDFYDPLVWEYLLSGNFYDMIGLIDNISPTIQATGASSALVSGRDLMKLLIEESSTYLAIPDSHSATVKGGGLIANDSDENWGRPFRNIMAGGEMYSGGFYVGKRTVHDMLSFIISTLASIEIAPDELFCSYQAQEDRGEGYGISRYLYWDWGVDERTGTNKQVSRKSGYSLNRAAGIWQIIKLQIDNYSVSDRVVLENRLATYSGSIINALKMYADDVFIELFGDTYIDQYFLIVRRPPFSERCIRDYYEKLVLVDNSPLTIKSDFVVSDQLGWYNGCVYSWYKIELPYTQPSGVRLPMTIFPVVFFREYCEVWGSNAMYVQSNYIPWDESGRDVYKKQMYEDLAYMVESNAYLPFTRTGTIVIKGDRRFKRGVWIKYEPTNELFYVDSVSQSHNVTQQGVERLTTLSVSRGMVISNKSGQDVFNLYFKIIDGLKQTKTPKRKPKQVPTDDHKTLNIEFDSDSPTILDVTRQGINDNPLFDDDWNSRSDKREKSFSEIRKFTEYLYTKRDIKQVNVYGNCDETNTQQTLSEERAQKTWLMIVDQWGRLYNDEFPDFNVTIIGNGATNLVGSSKGLNGVKKRNNDSKNRRVEIELLCEQPKPEDEPVVVEQDSDFSKWSVNQGVFNFFKAKRQFCDSIEDFEKVGEYTKSSPPTDWVKEDTSSKDKVIINIQITPEKQIIALPNADQPINNQ